MSVVACLGLATYLRVVVVRTLLDDGRLQAALNFVDASTWVITVLLPVGAALAWGIARRRGGGWWPGLVVAGLVALLFRLIDLDAVRRRRRGAGDVPRARPTTSSPPCWPAWPAGRSRSGTGTHEARPRRPARRRAALRAAPSPDRGAGRRPVSCPRAPGCRPFARWRPRSGSRSTPSPGSTASSRPTASWSPRAAGAPSSAPAPPPPGPTCGMPRRRTSTPSAARGSASPRRNDWSRSTGLSDGTGPATPEG